jgi:hypothetical protein
MNAIIREVREQEPIELIKWRLSRECYVIVELRDVVTQEAIDRLIQFLELIKDCFPKDEIENHPFRWRLLLAAAARSRHRSRHAREDLTRTELRR